MASAASGLTDRPNGPTGAFGCELMSGSVVRVEVGKVSGESCLLDRAVFWGKLQTW